MEILELHKLKLEHFTDMEQAMKAADSLVETQKNQMPMLQEKFPPMLFPGIPQLDQFYYAQNMGTMAAYRFWKSPGHHLGISS